jgi:ABC-type spermidine/putrescine transport system permease subunit II
LAAEVITGLSLLLFFLLIKLPLGMTTIVIAHASFSASFVYFIMVEQLRKLDPQMQEAAQDLGAKPSETFWQVTLPNILPGVMGGWLLAFTLSFDDFLISFHQWQRSNDIAIENLFSDADWTFPEINGLAFVMILLSTSLVVVLLSSEKSRKWVLRGKG